MYFDCLFPYLNILAWFFFNVPTLPEDKKQVNQFSKIALILTPIIQLFYPFYVFFYESTISNNFGVAPP